MKDDIKTTMQFGDRPEIDLTDVTSRFKNTDADSVVTQRVYEVTAEELRQFVERYEELETEKKDLAEQQAEVLAEAKGRGYHVKAIKAVVKLRSMKPDELAEQDAVIGMYRAALKV